jgi:hypothetical protein
MSHALPMLRRNSQLLRVGSLLKETKQRSVRLLYVLIYAAIIHN